MLESKNIVIHSEQDISIIQKIKIQYFRFENKYETFNNIKHTYISEETIDISIDNYKKSKYIGMDNYLDIPIYFDRNINVIAFQLIATSFIPIDKISDQNNITYKDDYILIRELQFVNYYYFINNDKIEPFPSINKYAAEVKISLNKLKNTLYSINNVLCEMMIYKNPVINQIGLNRYSFLSKKNVIETQPLHGIYNGLTNDIPNFAVSLPFTSDMDIKHQNYTNICDYVIMKMPLIALPYVSNNLIKSKIDKVSLSNIILDETLTKLNNTTYTSIYYNLLILSKYLHNIKKYINNRLINDEIKKISNYLNEEIVIKYYKKIIDDAYNQMKKNGNYNIIFYNHHNQDIMLPIYMGTKMPKEIFTQHKLNNLCDEYVKNTSFINEYIKIIDENIILLNNIELLDKKYINPDDSIILHMTNNKNKNMNKYCLFMFYFINIPKYPILSFVKKTDIEILNYIDNNNLKLILCKLLLAIQGYKLLLKYNKYNISDINLFTDNWQLPIFFYEIINNNILFDKLEKIYLYENIIGTELLLDIKFDGYNLYDDINIGLSNKINIDINMLTQDDIDNYYYPDIINLNDIKTLNISNPKQSYITIISNIITKFPKLSQKMIYNISTYDNLKKSDSYNKLLTIKLNL